MRLARTPLLALAAAVVALPGAAAQRTGGETKPLDSSKPAVVTPATRRPRIGYAVQAPPPAAPAPQPQPVVYVVPQVVYVLPAAGLYDGSPYVILGDGSMLFYYYQTGYQRVVAPCAPAPADPWARDALGRIPDPPGIAALKAGTRGQLSGTLPGYGEPACYQKDPNGRVAVRSAR